MASFLYLKNIKKYRLYIKKWYTSISCGSDTFGNNRFIEPSAGSCHFYFTTII